MGATVESIADSPAPERRRWLLATEAVVLAALVAAWFVGAGRTPPTVAWGFGETRSSAEPFAEFPSGFPLRLELDLPRPMFVYVASHDTLRGNVALWPSTQLRTDVANGALRAGHHVLPGSWRDQSIAWHVGDQVGVTTFMVIASETPIDDLTATMRSFRQMGNTAFPDRTTCATYAPDAGMDAMPPRSSIAHALLAECAALATAAHDGPMHPLASRDRTWASVMHAVSPLPAEPPSAEAIRKELAERFGTVQEPPDPSALPVAPPAAPPDSGR